MKGKMLNNFSLKILSIICAIILWAVIVNIYDPSTNVTVTGVTVTLLNAQSLTDKDYTFEVVDGSMISVYIKGPRSIVSDIKAADIIATADLSKVTAFSDYVDIDVKILKEGVSTSGLEVTPKTTAIKLSIENRVSKTFNIQMETAGTPDGGYIVSDSKISPTTVKLTGSASAINNVSMVKATYDVSGVSMDISDIAQLKLFDEAGNPIYDTKIEMGKTTVDFKVTILPSKTIPVKFKSQGEVAAGYKLTGIDYSNVEVVVAGTEENLKKIDSVEVSADAIDITNINATKEFVINIKNYLPSYLILVSDSKITATAKVSMINEKEFTVNLDSINLINLSEGYSVSYENMKQISIIVIGTETVVNAVTATDFKPTIDASGFIIGKNSAVLNITLPNGASLKKVYNVEATVISNKEIPAPTVVDSTISTTPAIH